MGGRGGPVCEPVSGFSCASAAAAAVRKASRIPCVFCIFSPGSVGLGRAAGDAFFGLIGFGVRHVRGARAERKQAHVRSS